MAKQIRQFYDLESEAIETLRRIISRTLTGAMPNTMAASSLCCEPSPLITENACAAMSAIRHVHELEYLCKIPP